MSTRFLPTGTRALTAVAAIAISAGLFAACGDDDAPKDSIAAAIASASASPAAKASAGQLPDACSALTADQLKDAIGADAGAGKASAGQEGGSVCTYNPGGADSGVVVVVAIRSGGNVRETFEAARPQSLPIRGFGGDRAAEFEAIRGDASGTTTVHVIRGDRALTITLTSPESSRRLQAARQLAELIAPKL